MIDKEDFQQEYRIQKWLHPGQHVKTQVFDILKSKAYNYSYKDRVIHSSIDAIMNRPDGEAILPSVDRWDFIDECIDLRDMLRELSSRDRSIMLMIMRGYSQTEIAILKGLCDSSISKAVNKAYRQIRAKKGNSYYDSSKRSYENNH